MSFVAAKYKVHEHRLHTRSVRVVHNHTISVVGVVNSVIRMRMCKGTFDHSNARSFFRAHEKRISAVSFGKRCISSAVKSVQCHRAKSRFFLSVHTHYFSPVLSKKNHFEQLIFNGSGDTGKCSNCVMWCHYQTWRTWSSHAPYTNCAMVKQRSLNASYSEVGVRARQYSLLLF